MDPSLSNSTPMDLLNVTEDSQCTHHLSSLACITLVCSDHLCSCSLSRWPCNLAVALSSQSKRNLFLTLSRFISVELDSEGSIVSTALNVNFEELWHACNIEMYVYLCTFVQFTFLVYGHTYVCKQASKQASIHASCNAVPLVWSSFRLTPKILQDSLFYHTKVIL